MSAAKGCVCSDLRVLVFVCSVTVVLCLSAAASCLASGVVRFPDSLLAFLIATTQSFCLFGSSTSTTSLAHLSLFFSFFFFLKCSVLVLSHHRDIQVRSSPVVCSSSPAFPAYRNKVLACAWIWFRQATLTLPPSLSSTWSHVYQPTRLQRFRRHEALEAVDAHRFLFLLLFCGRKRPGSMI